MDANDLVWMTDGITDNIKDNEYRLKAMDGFASIIKSVNPEIIKKADNAYDLLRETIEWRRMCNEAGPMNENIVLFIYAVSDRFEILKDEILRMFVFIYKLNSKLYHNASCYGILYSHDEMSDEISNELDDIFYLSDLDKKSECINKILSLLNDIKSIDFRDDLYRLIYNGLRHMNHNEIANNINNYKNKIVYNKAHDCIDIDNEKAYQLLAKNAGEITTGANKTAISIQSLDNIEGIAIPLRSKTKKIPNNVLWYGIDQNGCEFHMIYEEERDSFEEFSGETHRGIWIRDQKIDCHNFQNSLDKE